jgi:hypothetical protein
MSSWKQKLASKIDNNQPSVAQTPAVSVNSSGGGGWKQRIAEKKDVPSDPLPKVTININDMNDFPSLSSASAAASSAPVAKKATNLTNYVALAKEWADHSREEQARLDAEKTQREIQEFSFNYNAMSALDKLNYTLYSYSMLDTPKENKFVDEDDNDAYDKPCYGEH